MTPEVKERIEQIRHGIVPEGYTKTEHGIVPILWKKKEIRDIACISQGFTFKREFQGCDSEYWNYFKVADIGIETNSRFLSKAINTISDDLKRKLELTPFKAGSIVFPRVGAALLNNKKKVLAHDSLVDDNVLVLSVVSPDICNSTYLYYALEKVRLEEWCNASLVPVINARTVYKYILISQTSHP